MDRMLIFLKLASSARRNKLVRLMIKFGIVPIRMARLSRDKALVKKIEEAVNAFAGNEDQKRLKKAVARASSSLSWESMTSSPHSPAIVHQMI